MLYVAGPMTGLLEFNHPAFRAAAADLEAVGYTVLDPSRREADPAWTWVDYMRPALVDVLAADGVALLPGHQNSRGARLEVTVAQALELPVRRVHEWLEASA